MDIKNKSKNDILTWRDAFNEWYKTSDEYLGDINLIKKKI